MNRSSLFASLFTLLCLGGFAQFTVTSADSAAFYVKKVLMGEGIAVTNIHYKGYKKSIGTFKADKKIIGLDQGLILSTGAAGRINGPNEHSNYTSRAGEVNYLLNGDNDLKRVIKAQLYDVCSLEFDFTPVNNRLSFDYVFASEEYPEYVGSPFNDIFCFFIREKGDTAIRNIALVPKTNVPIAINQVNWKKNSEYFRRNYDENMKTTTPKGNLLMTSLEFDGLTRVLTAECDVIPYHVYHMKLIIADASDADYDSGVFIKANSFVSTVDSAGKYFSVVQEIKKKHIRFDPDSIFKLPPQPKNAGMAKEPEPIVKKSPDPFVKEEEGEKSLGRITVYFDTDKSELKPKEKAKLDSILKVHSVKDFSRVELFGFTDSIGSKASNQKLAYNRDASIRSYFIGKGLEPGKVKHNEANFLKEIATNATEQGRARNRRVEVVFYRRTN
jgi:outer membrane protein OmpA-like peptidoglycan-associated protein